MISVNQRGRGEMMMMGLPVVDGTISKGWPPQGYTGFVYTAGRRDQPWAYLSKGLIIAYGVSRTAALGHSNPWHMTR